MIQVQSEIIEELRSELPVKTITRNTTPLSASLPNEMVAQIEQLRKDLACERSTVIKMLIQRGLKSFETTELDDTARKGTSAYIEINLAPEINRAIQRARLASGKTIDEIINGAIAEAFGLEISA